MRFSTTQESRHHDRKLEDSFGRRARVVRFAADSGMQQEREYEQSSNNMSQSATPAPAAAPIDPATAATVSGTVKFDGTAPKASKMT